jgi:hypothetical protein
MLLSLILKKKYLNNSLNFLEHLSSYSVSGPTLCGASIDHTTEVDTATILVLLVTNKLKDIFNGMKISPPLFLPFYHCLFLSTRTVCKFRGPALLLRVETLWRCGDGLFFEVPPLASDALLTTLHPLLEISCLGAPFSWLEKPRNRMGRDLNWILCLAGKKWIDGSPLKHPPYSPDLAPCDFWAFPVMKEQLRRQKFRSDQRSAARFREGGGAL